MPPVAQAMPLNPDFRVAMIGWPDGALAMVKLTQQQQAQWVEATPSVFVSVSGVWGQCR